MARDCIGVGLGARLGRPLCDRDHAIFAFGAGHDASFSRRSRCGLGLQQHRRALFLSRSSGCERGHQTDRQYDAACGENLGEGTCSFHFLTFSVFGNHHGCLLKGITPRREKSLELRQKYFLRDLRCAGVNRIARPNKPEPRT